VFNVLTGDPLAIGGALTASPLVRKLSFTGSTEVGRLLMAQCAATIKKTLARTRRQRTFHRLRRRRYRGGGRGGDHRQVPQYRPDLRLCQPAAGSGRGVRSLCRATRQSACSRSRVGPGSEEGVTQGPLIDAAALAKVEAHVADAARHTARGWSPAATGMHRGGTFFEPTVLADVTPAMRVAQRRDLRPGGAGFPLQRRGRRRWPWPTTPSSVSPPTSTARDVARCLRVGEALEYGMVGINTGLISNEVAPFGGVKQSGIGREGSRSTASTSISKSSTCASAPSEVASPWRNAN
jgi:succinate-semialdehyde dehydrogenase/glutarate-semialdehyde dehydrogenase